jgi:hypothetical protein
MLALRNLINGAEKLANESKMPARIVDWACDIYDRLNDRAGMVSTGELCALAQYCDDSNLMAIEYLLDSKH